MKTWLLKRPAQELVAVRELLLPRACIGCGRAETWWCPRCHVDCRSAPQVFSASEDFQAVAQTSLLISSSGVYDGGLRRVILRYKESGFTVLADPLASLLCTAVVAHPKRSGALCLVPVPASRQSVQRRGFHALRRVVDLAARQLGLPVVSALRFRRQPGAQKLRGRQQRYENVAGAMVATREGRVIGRDCLLVDDVTTTGATLLEAQRALASTGVTVVGAACIAHSRSGS